MHSDPKSRISVRLKCYAVESRSFPSTATGSRGPKSRISISTATTVSGTNSGTLVGAPKSGISAVVRGPKSPISIRTATADSGTKGPIT